MSSDPLSEREADRFAVARRAVLRAAGASAALALGSGAVAATPPDGASTGPGSGGGSSNPNYIDPIFGQSSAGPIPNSFPPTVRPSHEVEVHIDLPPDFVFAAGQLLTPAQKQTVNAAVASGDVSGLSGATVFGDVSLLDIGHALLDTVGFHYEPAGLKVAPGEVVLVNATTPDHGVAAYHERHGRQNRVPEGVGPISAPLIPVGGYWLYRFEEVGVYDLYCPPHEVFGMVLRVVVCEDGGDVPQLDGGPGGRPPDDENLLSLVFGGLDPNVPSAAEALASPALSPVNVADEGEVAWDAVVDEHRGV